MRFKLGITNSYQPIFLIAGEEVPVNAGPAKVPVRPGNQQDIVLDEVPAESERDLIEKKGEEKNQLGMLSSYGDSEKAAEALSSE